MSTFGPSRANGPFTRVSSLTKRNGKNRLWTTSKSCKNIVYTYWLRSWRDFAHECFCFGSETVNASGEAVRGLVKGRVQCHSRRIHSRIRHPRENMAESPATPLLAFFFSEWHGLLEASIGKKTETISTIEARLVFKFTYTTYLHT